MRNPFKTLAKYVVAAYANRLYKEAVKHADKRHAQEKCMIFVISGLVNPSQLVCCSRKEFLAVKKKLRILDNITSPKKGSWYHTADSIEKNALDRRDGILVRYRAHRGSELCNKRRLLYCELHLFTPSSLRGGEKIHLLRLLYS